MSVRHLESMFNPASIALVGASNQQGSVGAVVMRNLLRSGFEGPIMPVNPRQRAIAGVLAYPSIQKLPITPELAVVCTPPQAVPEVIRQCGERGTKAAIVITAGLTREQTADGLSVRDAMLQAAKPHTLRILGPNSVGLLVPSRGINATFSHADSLPGKLAFVSQSGAFCTVVLDWARPRGIGFSHFVSLGDTSDVDFSDTLDYLASDAETTAILLYIESIQPGEARKFLSAARAASRNKPVLAIKAGRFAEGAKAAFSHTGSLAGADGVYDAALRRAGILRVFDMDELFDAVETLARARPPRGDRLCILTNGGGPGVIAADALAAVHGQLAELSAETLSGLDQVLPATWSHGNPIDMVGDANANRYVQVLDVLFRDPGIDAILVMNAPSAIAPSVEAAKGIVGTLQKADRTILTSWIGGESAGRARRVFADANIATYDTPEDAVRAFTHLVRFRRNREILTQVPASAAGEIRADIAAAREAIEGALRSGRTELSEPEAKRVLAAYGIPVVPTEIAADPKEAAALAERMGCPVVLKILSHEITHKSDVGGVVLDLDDADEVRDAARSMLARVARRRPDAKILGFAVQKMIERPKAHELIVGASTDPMFGPVILFGRGGVAVEVFADRSIELPPLNISLARLMVERTEVNRLLRGYRDRPAADIDAICGVLTRVSQLVCDQPEIVELDVNPLLADADGVLALDARIRVAAAKHAAAERLAIRPYPRELEEQVTLRSGLTVQLRPIRPEDQAAHERFVARLSPEDVRSRFLGVVREVPPSEVARLTQIDYAREMAFVAVSDDETLGVVRMVCDPDGQRADFAVIVRSDQKRRGLGTALLRKLVAYAQRCCVREIAAQFLPDNEPMIRLARQMGFQVRALPEIQRTEARMRLE